ncbi:MAG: type IV conjugative transfer system protein TraL [Nitrospirae bacterium]|nr:MAG: type IV conjugative transfer system protein TraL [Nitrospirota bacterium]
MKKKFPQYLSAPYQVLWMEVDEMAVFFTLLIFVYIFTSWITFFLMIIGTYLYSVTKKKYPRGFLKHCLYFLGFIDMKGYPTFFEKEFLE